MKIPLHTCAAQARQADREAGFSLLELMVVVVILSILALVIAPRIMDRPDQARVARVEADLNVLESAISIYRLDNYVYPTTEQGLRALVERPTIEPLPPNWARNGYIDRLPQDPWGRPYQYLQPGLHGPFDVFSLGADGVAGGEGADADVGSWTTR